MTYVKALSAGVIALSAPVLFSSPAAAGGIAAGTLIENTASATYRVGAQNLGADSNTVVLRVDELLDVTVASQDSGPVPATGPTAVLTFSITNTGNGPEAFNLTVNPDTPGNDFTPVVDGIAVDTNGNGVYDPGVDQILGASAPTGLLDPDVSLIVFVLVTVPGTAADTDTAVVNLLAEAVTGTGAPGTVFAGQGEGGGDAVAGATGADDDDDATVVVRAIAVAISKSATVVDPFGGSQPVPGAIITYTLLTTVSGTGTIEVLDVTDAIPAGTSYRSDSLALDAAPLTDAVDGDIGSASAAGIDVAIGDASAGDSFNITFDVIID
ncbi:hypothetical protein [Allopontixanthobacter sediminis]|uniref:hypothetical protein n=1 Tax=Allopontixanthobacter sediminis TaxID=1689985 RepID=UPI001E4F010C|nr:hypothetical protein [Allopontixanthobacter sediminis]